MPDLSRRPEPEHELERWADRFERLDWLGRLFFVGGSTVRLAANLIDGAAHVVGDAVAESRRVLRSELDPRVEDAKILEEYARDERPPRGADGKA